TLPAIRLLAGFFAEDWGDELTAAENRRIRAQDPDITAADPGGRDTLLEGGNALSHSGGSIPCHANRTTRLLSAVGSMGFGEIPGTARSSTNLPPPTCCSNIRCTPHVAVARTCAISWRGSVRRSRTSTSAARPT